MKSGLGSGGMYYVYICVCGEEIKCYTRKGRKRYRCRPQAPPRHRCFDTAHSLCNESFPKTGYSPHTTHLSLSPH